MRYSIFKSFTLLSGTLGSLTSKVHVYRKMLPLIALLW
jgi:hypothetical protein